MASGPDSRHQAPLPPTVTLMAEVEYGATDAIKVRAAIRLKRLVRQLAGNGDADAFPIAWLLLASGTPGVRAIGADIAGMTRTPADLGNLSRAMGKEGDKRARGRMRKAAGAICEKFGYPVPKDCSAEALDQVAKDIIGLQKRAAEVFAAWRGEREALRFRLGPAEYRKRNVC